MSHLRGTDVTLRSVLESDTEGYLGKGAAQPTLGVLTKLIDSAERLTLQVHPDKPTALRLFQSQYGKTECWHILSGHPVNGEEPCIYYGFQPDMTRARWEALFHAQDIPGMLAGMQKYPVHPGDTILISITRDTEFIIPHGSTILLPWDHILCLTRDDSLHELTEAWGLSDK